MDTLTQQIPMLSVPLKMTEEADFTESFKKYISEFYQEDPETYMSEIATLNRLRQDTRGIGKDISGRDIIYRYYGQLELLDLRFPIDEKNVKVLFTWYDAFTEIKISQYSVAYEKACVIFNIAAVLSAIAANQNRFEEEGRKLAYNYFQAAAGLFLYISDNFLHAPSVDISKESVKCLSKLMLASAQECFLEKTIFEKKKPALLCKIAAYLSFIYNEISDDMNSVELRDQFNDTWDSLMKLKSKYYATITNYYKALASEDEGKYGYGISYLTLAENNVKEANKLAKNFAYNYPSFSVSSSDTQSASTGKTTASSQAFVEVTKAYQSVITEKKKGAIKDNDLIYQEDVPNSDTIQAPEKLCIVKTLTFADICPNGSKDVANIIGRDIFTKLIPMSVHESSSIYSEEKSKILRSEIQRCDDADNNFKIALETLNIVETINRLKDYVKNDGINESMISFPEEVSTWCKLIQEESNTRNSMSSMITSLSNLQKDVQEGLNMIGYALDQEQRDFEMMTQKYGGKWTQEPSVTASTQIRQNLKKYRTSLEEALNADNILISKYHLNKSKIEMLEQPIEIVKEIYLDSILSKITKKEDANLIDTTIDDKEEVKKNEKEKIESIEKLLLNLRGCQGERRKLIEELKVKIQNDDISSVLLMNKNKEKKVFQVELGKYQNLCDNISRNVRDNADFINSLVEQFNDLKKNSISVEEIQKIEDQKEAKIAELKEIYDTWKEIVKNLESGIQCYNDLKEKVEKLQNDLNIYIKQRSSQRTSIEKKIQSSSASEDQKLLLEQLNKLNINTSSTVTASAPLSSSTNLSMKNDNSIYNSSNSGYVSSIQPTSINQVTSPVSMSNQLYSSNPIKQQQYNSTSMLSPTQQATYLDQNNTNNITSPKLNRINSLSNQNDSNSIPSYGGISTNGYSISNNNKPFVQIPTSTNENPISTQPPSLPSSRPASQIRQPSISSPQTISYQSQPTTSQYQYQQSPPSTSQTQLSYQQPPQSATPQAQPYQQQPQSTTPQVQPYQQPPQSATPQTQPYQQQPQSATPQVQPYQQPPQSATPQTQPYQQQPQPAIPQIQPYQQPHQSTTPQTQSYQQQPQSAVPQPQPYQPQTYQQQPPSVPPQVQPYQLQSSYQQSSSQAYQQRSQIQTPYSYKQQVSQPTPTIQENNSFSAYSTVPAYSQTHQTQQNQYMYQYQSNPLNNTIPSNSTTQYGAMPPIPPKPTSSIEPLSSQMISPVRPPLPPPPGSMSFTNTSSITPQQYQPPQLPPPTSSTSNTPSYYNMPPPPPPQQQQQQPTLYNAYQRNSITQLGTSMPTNNPVTPAVYPYGAQGNRPYSMSSSQYNSIPAQPSTVQPSTIQPQQQPIVNTMYNSTPPSNPQNYGYQQPVQQQQPYYQQMAPNQNNQYNNNLAIQNQNQQLASLSQYKPLKPQQYQPSLLD